MDQLIDSGVKHIILAVSYRHECFISLFNNEYRGVRISYSIEEQPLGTGGGIKQALGLCEYPSDVLVINGDTFVDTSISEFYRSHLANSSDLSMLLVRVDDMYRYGSVDFVGQEILSFREKGVNGPGFINGGIYIVSQRLNLPEGAHSFESDFLYQNTKLAIPFPVHGYFIDIGVPDDYYKACAYFK